MAAKDGGEIVGTTKLPRNQGTWVRPQGERDGGAGGQTGNEWAFRFHISERRGWGAEPGKVLKKRAPVGKGVLPDRRGWEQK